MKRSLACLESHRMVHTLLLGALAAFGAGCPGLHFTADLPDTNGGNGMCGDTPWVNPTELKDNCGVFVSPAGDDVDGAGTQEKPLRTLSKALTKAASESRPVVFACKGVFEESIELPAGISLVGGFDNCTGAAWTWVEGGERTVLKGPADSVALRVLGTTPNYIESFVIQAGAANTAGGSSIAVVVQSNSVVGIKNSELVAADAADGEHGMSGPAMAPETPLPDATNIGIDACADATQNKGGFLHANQCPSAMGPNTMSSIGGAGGDGQESTGENGQAGSPFVDMKGAGGLAGLGCAVGGAGQNGADGQPGMPGAGANDIGRLSISLGWMGSAGGDGAYGTPGQGGGGGAGQKGMAGCAGASGGAGGAGGCGGEGGKGGLPGGSSIALVSIDAAVTFDNVLLKAGKGGKGGDGGDAQAGGLGADGSLGGGNAMMISLEKGCKGGLGGEGGAGGPGGGGSGGHSLAIAFKGTAPTGSRVVTLGEAGLGGNGGGGNAFQNQGSVGTVVEQLLFENLSANGSN